MDELKREREKFLVEAAQQATKGKWTKAVKEDSGQAITTKQKNYLRVLRRQLAERASLNDWMDVIDWLDQNPMPVTLQGAMAQIAKLIEVSKMGIPESVRRTLNAGAQS